MMFNKLIQILLEHHRKILYFSLSMFILDGILLGASNRVTGGGIFSCIAFGFSHSAGFLLTVDSPNGIQASTTLLQMAFWISWAVSFSGWLFIPTLVGALISRKQAMDAAALQQAESHIRQWGHAAGISENDLDSWVEGKLNIFRGLAGLI